MATSEHFSEAEVACHHFITSAANTVICLTRNLIAIYFPPCSLSGKRDWRRHICFVA